MTEASRPTSEHAPLREPPGPRGPIRTAVQYTRDPLGFFTRCARDYGDVVGLHFPRLAACLVSRPELIEDILTSKHTSFIKTRDLRELRNVVGDGLLTSQGNRWRTQRRRMQPAFHQDRLQAYAPMMTSRAEGAVARWRPGESRDVHRDMMRLTLEIVGKVLFDLELHEEVPRIGRALEAALRQWALRVHTSFLLPAWLPIPTNVRARRAIRRVDEFILRLIRDRRAAPHESPRDLLDLLLTDRSQDGGHLSDTALRDECMTIFLAGHETTAIALSWTWYLLAQHPAVEAELCAELRRVLAGRTPTAGDLPELRFTRNVVRESLRLYPPAWTIGREAVEDCDLGGFSIRRGTQVYMSQWVVHRDPRYFAEPDHFRPERWTDDFERALPRFAYFPFGGGPRVCIGAGFALMEAALLLATIAQRVHLELDPAHPVRPWPSVTLRPRGGIRMVPVRRGNFR